MAENNIQENLIKLKELRKNEIDNSNNEGVLIFIKKTLVKRYTEF